MKSLCIIFILSVGIFNSSIYAQISGKFTTDYPYHLIGSDLRADVNSRQELTYRWLGTGIRSFGVKFAHYNYENDIPSLTLYTKIPNISAQHYYNIKGVSLKVGWIISNSVDKNFLFNHGVYIVASRNEHHYQQVFSDSYFIYKEEYSKLKYSYGFEYEFHGALRFMDNFLLSVSVQTGLKPSRVYLFNDVVDGLRGYSNYGPSQGFGPTRFYISASVGLGFMF